MGVSTNAILFYGYSWDEENNDRPWTIGVELDELVLEEWRGVPAAIDKIETTGKVSF
jgi:hypothetical protein